LDCGGLTPLLVTVAISQKRKHSTLLIVKSEAASFQKWRQAAVLKSGVKPPQSKVSSRRTPKGQAGMPVLLTSPAGRSVQYPPAH
jgi:hypothetical protein